MIVKNAAGTRGETAVRLFYAINFPKEVKDKLADMQNGLRRQLAAGRFTLYDNLHLTLVFIGEIPEHRAGALFDIADALRFEPFELCIEGVGSFRRGGGHILWAGVRENDRLQALYDRLSGDVRAAGYSVEARRYTPHLTLAREAKFRPGAAPAALQAPAGPIYTTVTKVSLMLSERIGGRLTYTEIR
jgi:2'-5' RNA ligase